MTRINKRGLWPFIRYRKIKDPVAGTVVMFDLGQVQPCFMYIGKTGWELRCEGVQRRHADGPLCPVLMVLSLSDERQRKRALERLDHLIYCRVTGEQSDARKALEHGRTEGRYR